MAQHSVENHLQMNVEDYDRRIRTYIPHYEEMFEVATHVIQNLCGQEIEVLDLGGGTGALTSAILKNCPEAKVRLVDIDPQMLAQAKQRLDWAQDRVLFQEGNFYEPLPASDVVVASLSLHHIPDLSLKQVVYRNILNAIKPGGLFLNLDVAISEQPWVRGYSFAKWAAFMETQGIQKTEAYNHFAAWADKDCYFSLADELQSMKQAGFAHVECFWRKNPLAILGGLVPA